MGERAGIAGAGGLAQVDPRAPTAIPGGSGHREACRDGTKRPGENRSGAPCDFERERASTMQMNATDIDVYVGRRMRQLRESLGLSQGRLGRQLGLTFSQVQKYEKGANRIGAGRLYLLAALMDVPIQYFFEDMGAEPERLDDRRPTRGRGTELRELEDAFLSIRDDVTRRSLVALVRSLAAPKTGAEGAHAISG